MYGAAISWLLDPKPDFCNRSNSVRGEGKGAKWLKLDVHKPIQKRSFHK